MPGAAPPLAVDPRVRLGGMEEGIPCPHPWVLSALVETGGPGAPCPGVPRWQRACKLPPSAAPFTCEQRRSLSRGEEKSSCVWVAGPRPLCQPGQPLPGGQLTYTAGGAARQRRRGRSLRETHSSLLTWEEVSGLLRLSPELRLSGPARGHQESAAFQTRASDPEKLILETHYTSLQGTLQKVLLGRHLAAKSAGRGC